MTDACPFPSNLVKNGGVNHHGATSEESVYVDIE